MEATATPTVASTSTPIEHFKREVDWIPTLFIVSIHIAALFALFMFNWTAFWICIGLHFVTGGLGITLCFHRLLTHSSFKVVKPIEYLLTIMGALACQSGAISWVATHRMHHKMSDLKGDPHTPREGFFWAHMGWCLHKVYKLESWEEKKKWAPDLAKDPVHVFLDKYYFAFTLLLAGGLYMWGGWSFVFWGIFMRLVLVYHSTWLVNSAAHIWGYRTYDSKDQSTNNWWVALLSYGEGWHNNHHAFQSSARHGIRWWEIDLTYMMINALKFFRLAKDIKIPTPHQLTTKATSA